MIAFLTFSWHVITLILKIHSGFSPFAVRLLESSVKLQRVANSFKLKFDYDYKGFILNILILKKPVWKPHSNMCHFVPQAMTRKDNSWEFILLFIRTYHPGCKKDINYIYSSMTSWGDLTNVVYTQILNQFKSLIVNFKN